MSAELQPFLDGTRSWPYLGMEDGELVDLGDRRDVPAIARLAYDAFTGLVSSPAFVCVGGKAAVSRGTFRVGIMGDLGAAASTETLAEGLRLFRAERGNPENDFFSYAAVFSGPMRLDEEEFEAALWDQLRSLNRVDRAGWDPLVSPDPTDPRFSFSFGGDAFFVVGLHAASSRWSRRFAWPTLVFNPHDQFDQLRDDGRMVKWQETIRAADTDLQGSPNPNLSDFGELPEARQYSGKANPRDWNCPFHMEPA